MNIVHDYERAQAPAYPVPSIHRAFVLLELLGESQTGMSLAELVRSTGWPKSSVYNILMTLVMDRYITYDPETSRYRMTIKLFSVGGVVVERLDIRSLAHPLLLELRERTGETVNLGILDGSEAIYLETIAGPGAIRVNTWPGKRLPLHRTALGKALASDLPPETVAAIIAKTGLPASTPSTHQTLEALQADLGVTRQRGYALDDEEDELGMRCVGAPIRDYRGDTVAAISVTGLARRLPLEEIESVAGVVRTTAARISELLGYREVSQV